MSTSKEVPNKTLVVTHIPVLIGPKLDVMKEANLMHIPARELKDPTLRLARKCLGLWSADVLINTARTSKSDGKYFERVMPFSGAIFLKSDEFVILEWLDMIMDVVTQEHPSYTKIERVDSVNFRFDILSNLLTFGVRHDDGRLLQFTFLLPGATTKVYNDLLESELPPIGSFKRGQAIEYVVRVVYWVLMEPFNKKKSTP